MLSPSSLGRLTLVWLALAASASAAEVVLLEGGRSNYQIVLPDAQPTAALADSLAQTARLVQTAFAANGAAIPVVAEAKRDPQKPAIYLGDTQFARRQGIAAHQLRDWSYLQRVVGADLILVGRDHSAVAVAENNRRPNWDRVGTAKATVDFLRQFCGVRFLYPEVAPYNSVAAAAKIDLLNSPAIEYLPQPKIAIPADLNLTKTPLLRANTSHPAGGGFYDLAHNRFPRVNEVFGGHTWERAVPPEKHWPAHPEYFALIGGERLKPEGGRAQYCLSNPAVQQLIYDDLASWLARGYASVDLGQPDGFRECQCEACAKLYDTGANWSEKIWLFNRLLAERLHQAHPDREVVMMSYILTANPPQSFRTFPANTSIMLTGTNEEDLAPWRGVTVPRGFTGYVYNWCPNLGTRYTPMRTPGFIELQVKRLAENRIQSLYRDGPGQLFGLEGPVYYVMGRMFDDPQSNSAKQLLPEFCDAAFVDKSTAFYMRSFYDQLYHAIALYSNHLGTRCDVWTYQPLPGEGRPRKTVQDPFQLLTFLYPPNLLAALDADLTQAEKQARSPKAKTRLALVRTEFEYLRHLARAAQLHQAYQTLPDAALRDRLLDALDSRNAFIATLFDAGVQRAQRDAWSQVLFPFPGHDEKHLRLAYDGYQEPYANTCFNWDTAAMRTAPAPGKRRLSVAKTTATVTLDGPEWKDAPRHELTFVPPLKRLPRKTVLQFLYDAETLYVRGECDLPPDHPAEFPVFNRDRALTSQEALDCYFQPQPSRELCYRLAVGANPQSQFDAVSGLITDPIDPRFGKDDPTWNGAWRATGELDTAQHRWRTLLAIPFKTLAAEAPVAGVAWKANFARYHLLPNQQLDRSLWSMAPHSTSLDDRSLLGEIVFE